MPIECDVEVRPVSEATFKAIDYEIMSFAFDVHNDLGGFYDEKIYQQELGHRCREIGYESVDTEIPIRVSHRDFRKIYYVDLLINGSILYELKTVGTLVGEHQAQALNYLLLLGLQHGKLLNMRGSSVEHRFVSTTVVGNDRYSYGTITDGWEDVDDDSRRFRGLFDDLLADWGVFLDTRLFYDAIGHFWSGEDEVVSEVDVVSGERRVGAQRLCLLNERTGFRISSVAGDSSFYEEHLRRFVRHANIDVLQWVNFDHQRVVFRSLLAEKEPSHHSDLNHSDMIPAGQTLVW